MASDETKTSADFAKALSDDAAAYYKVLARAVHDALKTELGRREKAGMQLSPVHELGILLALARVTGVTAQVATKGDNAKRAFAEALISAVIAQSVTDDSDRPVELHVIDLTQPLKEPARTTPPAPTPSKKLH